MAISSALGNALIPTSYGFRNIIINGNFSINQRGYTSGSNLASGSYGFDRWKSTFTNTALTFTSAPQGQLVTISSGGSIEQIVERANVLAGSYVLSWTGTARARVYNSGSTPPAYAASPISVVLDGTANVEVEFAPASGTATLGQVQLELGSRATPYEARPVNIELLLCQRYYERIQGIGSASTDWANIGSGGWDSSTTFSCTYNYLVPKRARPSVFSTGTGINCLYHGVTWSAVTSVTSYTEISARSVRINYVGASSSVQGQAGIAVLASASAYIEVVSEL